MISTIPRSKTGDCSVCGDKDVAVVKVGRDFFCVGKCNKIKKAHEQIKKANERNKIRSLPHIDKEQKELNESRIKEQWDWFLDRKVEMTGKCKHCGNKSCKDDDKKFHFSISHLLPKAYFPSVSKHPENWVELCFWGNNCHGNMDNKTLDLIDMNCWDEIVTKFCKIYPSIAKEERRRIPEVLLQYLETENG